MTPITDEKGTAELSSAIPGARVDEIVEHLNSLRTYEYEYGTDLVSGLVVPWRVVTGTDANLEKATAAAALLTEVADGGYTLMPGAHEGWVRLTDGTLIEWSPAEAQWSVTLPPVPVPGMPASASTELQVGTEANRIRIYDGERLLATALRSNGRDGDWIGWQVTTVVNSRGAAFEALRSLAENPRVARAVTQ